LVEETKSGKGRVPCLAISWIIRACVTNEWIDIYFSLGVLIGRPT
jgi:hypothetical protein